MERGTPPFPPMGGETGVCGTLSRYPAKGYPPFRILTRLRLDHRDTQFIGFGLPVLPG
jgi:hypothetical protein